MIYNSHHDGSGTMALLWPPDRLACQAAGAEKSTPEVKRDYGAINQRAHFSFQLQLWFLRMNQDRESATVVQLKENDFALQSDKCHAKGQRTGSCMTQQLVFQGLRKKSN